MKRPDFESLICYNFSLGWRLVNAFYKPYLPDGISPQQTYILECCYLNDGVNIGDLSRCIKLDLAAVSALISRMEKQELLRREIDIENRRHIKVFLTPKGKRLRNQAWVSLGQADKKLFRLVKSQDIQNLQKLVRKLEIAGADVPGSVV